MAIKMSSKSRRNRPAAGATHHGQHFNSHSLNSSGSSMNSSPNSMPSPGHHGNSHPNASKSNRAPKNANAGYGSNAGSNAAGSQTQVKAEGAYGNLRLMHTTTSLMGCVVEVQLKNERTYEGIFKTFSPKYELVLETVIQIEKNSTLPTGAPNLGSLLASLHAGHDPQKTMIFALSDVVKLTAKNVDVDYALKGQFQTDTEISNRAIKERSGREDRELVPWQPDGDDGDSFTDELGLGLEEPGPDNDHNWRKRRSRNGSSQNGWDVNEMFKKNESLGVKSDFDEEMKIYTVPLQKDDSEEWRKKEELAKKLAEEIEKSGTSKKREELEDGDENLDEESKWGAVLRPPPGHTKPPREQPAGPKDRRRESGDDIAPRGSVNKPPQRRDHMPEPQPPRNEYSNIHKAPREDRERPLREERRGPRDRPREEPQGPRREARGQREDPRLSARDAKHSLGANSTHDQRPGQQISQPPPSQRQAQHQPQHQPKAPPNQPPSKQGPPGPPPGHGVDMQHPRHPTQQHPSPVPSVRPQLNYSTNPIIRADVPPPPQQQPVFSYARVASAPRQPPPQHMQAQNTNARPGAFATSAGAPVPPHPMSGQPKGGSDRLKEMNKSQKASEPSSKEPAKSSSEGAPPKTIPEVSSPDSANSRVSSQVSNSTQSRQESSHTDSRSSSKTPEISKDTNASSEIRPQKPTNQAARADSTKANESGASSTSHTSDSRKASPTGTAVSSISKEGGDSRESAATNASEDAQSTKSESHSSESAAAQEAKKASLNPEAKEFVPRFLQAAPTVPVTPSAAAPIPSVIASSGPQTIPGSSPNIVPGAIAPHISQPPVHVHAPHGHSQQQQQQQQQSQQHISHTRQTAMHSIHPSSQMMPVQPALIHQPYINLPISVSAGGGQHYVVMQPLQNPVAQQQAQQQSQQGNVMQGNPSNQGSHPGQPQNLNQSSHQQSVSHGGHGKPSSRGPRNASQSSGQPPVSNAQSPHQPAFSGATVINRSGHEYTSANITNPATGTPLITSAPMQVPTSMYGGHLIAPNGQPALYPYQVSGNRTIVLYDPNTMTYQIPQGSGHAYFGGAVQPINATPHGHGQQGSNPATPHSNTPNTVIHPNASPSPHQQQQQHGPGGQQSGVPRPHPTGTPNQPAQTPTPQQSIMFHQAGAQPGVPQAHQIHAHHPGGVPQAQNAGHPMQQAQAGMHHQQHYYVVGAAGFHPLPPGAVQFPHQQAQQPGQGVAAHQVALPGQPHGPITSAPQAPGQTSGAVHVQTHQHQMQTHAVPVSLIASQPYAAMQQHQQQQQHVQGQHHQQMIQHSQQAHSQGGHSGQRASGQGSQSGGRKPRN